MLGVLIFRLFPIFSNGFWNCSEDVVYLYLFIVVYILSMIIYTVCVGADVNTFSLLEYLLNAIIFTQLCVLTNLQNQSNIILSI